MPTKKNSKASEDSKSLSELNAKLKTVNIRGNDYVPVSERIKLFNEIYKNGSIQTQVKNGNNSFMVKAIVIPNIKNPDRKFIGHSREVIGQGVVNETSALENAETSAIGRALGIMGIGVLDSIASADEINKSGSSSPKANQSDPDAPKCPKCGNKMVKRTSARGPFWGCPNYPKCTGIVDYEKTPKSVTIDDVPEDDQGDMQMDEEESQANQRQEEDDDYYDSLLGA